MKAYAHYSINWETVYEVLEETDTTLVVRKIGDFHRFDPDRTYTGDIAEWITPTRDGKVTVGDVVKDFTVEDAQALPTPYQEHGYKNRIEYLKQMAEDYGIELSAVLAIARLLGENEDFDGLPSALEDLAAGLNPDYQD